MGELKHAVTGETGHVDGEIVGIYIVDWWDDEAEEFVREERVEFDGEEWIVVDDGVDMRSLGSGGQ